MGDTDKRVGGCRLIVWVWAVAIFTVVSLALALAPSAAGQTTINWLGGTGVWDNASLWSAVATPNSDTDVVTIGNTTVGNVTLDIDATIGDLILTLGNTLQINADALTVQAGTGTNGTVIINSGGTLELLNGGTLSATGTVAINSSGTLELLTGAALTAGGALTNAGAADIGSSAITSAVTASAASLNNAGTLNLAGNNTANPIVVTTLNISGAGVNGSGGNVNLTGSAVLSIAGNYTNSGTTNVDNSPSTPTGGSSLSVGGTLTNSSTVNIGSSSGNITSAATATAGALVNSGTLNVHGNIAGSSVPATLNVTGAAFTSGIPTEPFPAVNTGTINVESGASLSIAGNYGNFSTTNVDTTSDFSGGKVHSGGSTLNVSGVISNTGTSLSIGSANPQNSGLVTLYIGGTNGTLNLGNGNLTQPTEIIAGGLNNLGTVNITGTSTVQALLDLTGPASANPFVQPPAILNAGTYNLTNDAELEYSGPGISGIGTGVTVNLNGAGASISATNLTPNTSSGINSALNTLAGNAGTFALSNGAAVATNGALNFLNMSTVNVDQTGAGGSSFSIGGALENGSGATLSIGSGSITKPTTATSVFFSNYGTLNITGSTTTQSLLNVTAQQFANPFLPPSGVLGSGSYNLTNDAELEYLGPGIGAIGPGVTVNLNGANASINATNLAPNTSSGTNSALNTLASNAGTFELSNGVSVSTNPGTNFTNSSTVQVDLSGQGGSTVSIGGGLTNAEEILIGNASITKPTTVTVNGPLQNLGNALLEMSGATAVQTTLNVVAPAPNTLTGIVELTGDTLLEFGSGGITAIAGSASVSGGSLTLSGTNARVGLAGSTSTSSALAGLSSNGGSLVLANGATLSTNAGVNFVNSGGVSVDSGGSGGSTLNIGGTIANTGGLSVGDGSTTASSTLSASGFALNTLTGGVTITGENPGSGSKTAAVVLANGITSIGLNGALTLSNSNSYVALSGTSPLSNNGLNGLTSNAGMLTLQDGANVTTNPTFSFVNGGQGVTVDAAGLTSGSTNLNIGGTLNNGASLEITNLGSTGSSTAAVTAENLTNTSTIDLTGYSASHTATLTVNGSVTTSGNINVGNPNIGFGGNFATLTVASVYVQNAGVNAGQTTVTGTLTAPNVVVNSGVLQGNGTINGNVLNHGAMEGGAVTVPGGLAINGNYTQGASGALYQVVNGISNGQFSSLNVHGNASLSGALDITGFATLAQGQTFDILNITSTTGTVSGAFSGIEYKGQLSSGSVLNIGGGLALDLTYNSNDVVLSVGAFTPSATADIWNSGAGTWSATNTSAWSAGTVPASTSDVTIGSSTGGPVTLDPSVSPVNVNSLTVTNGYTLAFGAATESLTTNASVNIDTGGEIDLENSGDILTTGKGGSNGNLTNFGTLTVGSGGALTSGAALTVGGGGILTNSGTLTVQYGATLSVAGDLINGLPGGYVGGSAVASFQTAGPSVIGGNLTNNQVGTLNIDTVSNYINSQQIGGGTTLTVAGTLTNAGNLNIGGFGMTSPTTVNVASLLNTGDMTIDGTSTEFFASANVPSLLNITGSWIPGSGELNSGYYVLRGDAGIQYAGPGISTIGGQGYVLLDGSNSSINNTSLAPNTPSGVNSAFNTLTTNYGTVSLADGAQVQTNAGLNLTNNGELSVAGGLGESTLTVGGVLTNNGSLTIGAGGGSTVNVAGLINNRTIDITGCDYEGCTGTALLNVTGPAGSFIPASGALNQGTYSLTGDAVLQYAGSGISSIGTGAFVALFGANASIEATNLTPNNGSTNSALNTLANNAGLLYLQEGVSVATNAGLSLINTGEILVGGASTTFGAPATTLAVGGTLVNSGILNIGAGSYSAANVTAAGFSNNGSVYITGGTSTPALLDITGVAATNPFVSASGALSSGFYSIQDNGELEYTGPGITSIPTGTTVYLSGPASITATSLTPLTSTGANSALDTLTSNAGFLTLSGTAVSTAGDLLNTGQISMSGNGQFNGVAPPATLNVGGVLTNASNLSGQACASPSPLTACGLEIASGGAMTASGLVNSGSMSVSGPGAVVPFSYGPATVTLSGPVTNSGTIGVLSGGQLSATGAFTNTDTGLLGVGPGALALGIAPGTYITYNTLVGAAGFNNAGTVNISGGSGSFAPAATLTVTGSGNSYTQTGPLSTTKVDGTLTAPTVNINGGLLKGGGTINGNVVNSATVVATLNTGSSLSGITAPGLLTINGNYTQTSAGVLNELIQGPVKRGSDFGAINVSGAAALSGALDVTTLNGFTFAANQSYDLMNFTPGSLSGAFSTLEYNNLASSASGTGQLNIGGQLALAVVYQNSTGEVLLQVQTAQGPPTFDNWIGSTDVWSNGVNWSTGAPPTPTQDVYVGTGSAGPFGGQAVVTFNQTSATINSLTVEGSLGQTGSTNYALVIGAGNTLNVTKTVTNSDILEVVTSGALLTTGGNFANSAGQLYVANGGTVTVGSKAAPDDFINAGDVAVDAGIYNSEAQGTGGGSLVITGTLNNRGALTIGNSGSVVSSPGITSQSIVSAASLITTSGTTTLANTLGGGVLIEGENPGFGSAPAVLQLGTSITAIATGGSLTLANENAFITTDTSHYTNDGLSGLTSIAAGGRLSLGAGASATINGTLSNAASGSDGSGNPFGIFLSTTFFNNGTVAYDDLPTTLNVAGLNNTGNIFLTGCSAATPNCSSQALLNVTGPAGSFIPAGGALNAGIYSLSGNAELEYAGPGIASIASGVYVTLTGASASINATGLTPNNGPTNSAFNTLTSNAGNLSLGNGASITTNAGLNLTNSGLIEIASSSGQPLSTLTIGGALINNAGNIPLGSPGFALGNGTLNAAGLTNTGLMFMGEGGFGAANIGGTADNSGEIAVGGPMQVSGLFTNTGGGVLDIGEYTVGGGAEYLGAGSLSAGGFSNAGQVNIVAVPSGSLTVTSGNSYTQTGSAATTLVEGALTAPAVNINGGLLQGNGLITGNVTNAAAVAGAISPTTPGLLTINGSYTQTSAASLNELVQGASTRGTQFGAIDISGPATLAGTLNVTTVNGFAFAANESLDIMNVAPNGLSGTFDTLQYNGKSTTGTGLLNLGGNLALALAYEGSSGEVLLDVVTPDNWTNASGNWSAGTNWSGGLPGPTQLVNIGTGTGGTVTLDQSASIYNLNMEAGSSSGYTLAFNPSETLTTAGTVNLGTGGEIDVENSGAQLTAGGDFTNAGTLHLENGGVVAVGTTAEPRNFDNTGAILIDTASVGGSALNISGTLSDTGGQITIGSVGMTSAATVSASGFAGNTLTGVVHVFGNDTTGGAMATIELQNGITSIAANSDLLLLDANSQVNLSGAFGSNSALTGLTNVAGALQIENGSSLSTKGGLTVASTGSLGVDEFLFTGGGGSSLTVNGALNNAGTFSLGSGGFGLGTPPAIVSSATVSGFNNSGVAQIGGAYSTGVTLTVNGSAANSGSVSIVGGGEINVTGTNVYTQTAGTTTVNGLFIGSGIAVNGGTLRGAGYIGANVSNVSGTVLASADGIQPGTLSIGGSYTQGPGGTLNEIIGGTLGLSGQFSVLSAGVSVGNVTLGGALNISAINNFKFQAGQTFDIINFPANSLTGAFSTLEFDCQGTGNCVKDTSALNGTPLVITEGTTEVGIVANYLDSLGEVMLNVEIPPPTAVSWSGAGGAWSNTAAWSDGLMPLGYQDITIGSGAGGTVTYDQASSSIDSLTIGGGTSSNYALSFNSNTALAVTSTVTINSGGEIDVAAAGASLATGGALANAGTLNVSSGGSLAVGTLSAPADLTNSATGTMNVDAGTATGGSSVAVSGTLSNSGTLTIGNSGLTSPTSVSAGGFANSGILNMAGGSATNSASLTVNGNATNVLEANIGTFANLTVTGSANSYTQNCPGVFCLASTTVNGTLTAPAVNINAGVLQGTGTINGNVTNAGLVAGGSYLGSSTPGVLTVNGNYAQMSTGFLAETVAGTGTPGTAFSALNVSGTIKLDGTLEVSTVSGFAFASGQTFDILNFAPSGLTGSFATLQYGSASGAGAGVLSIGNNLDLSVAYNNAGGDLVLQVGSLDTWLGATDNWTGSNDSSNWSTLAKPTATQDVLVGGGSGGTVTYNETSDTVSSLTVQPGTTSAYKLAFGISDSLAVTNTVSINAGGEIDVEANGASLTIGGNFSNAGTLVLGQNPKSGQGGTAALGGLVTVGTTATPANLTNTGTINVDPASTPVLGVTPPTGGSILTVSGALNNSGGTLNIGNTGITSQSMVSAASLEATSGTNTLANTLDGTITITGQDPTKGATTSAVLQLGAGITNIAATGSLTLANSNSFLTIDTAAPFTNDGLSTLTSNAGMLTLDGSIVAITGSLANAGSLTMDNGANVTIGSSTVANLTNSGNISVGTTGGSKLAVNGTVDNGGGNIVIGNVGIASSDTMSAQGFAYNVTGFGTVSNTLNGNVAIAGNSSTTPGSATATLLLNAGIDAIATNSSLVLLNSNSFVNLSSGGGNNSGLSGLANIAGELGLENGAALTTSGDLTIASTGTVGVDDLFSSGGSKLTLGGALNNGGAFNAGTVAAATSPTTVSATGFANTGTTNLGGSTGGATFAVSGATTNSGTVNIASTGALNVTGGNSYTQSGASSNTNIQSGGSLSAASYIQKGGATTINGTLTSSSGVTLSGGTMQGTGTIAANVVNSAGTLQASPDGINPGTLTISGSYAHGSGATLAEFISGTGSGQFSVLNITGSLTLGGTLEVSTLNGFAFANKQTFDIIDFPANALSGTFATLAYNGATGSGTSPLGIGNNLTLALEYEPLGQDVVELVVSQNATNDTWVGTTDNWTNGNNDKTNWSTGSTPTSQQDTVIGGGPGGTVTLNEGTEVKSLTVEASTPGNSATNYTLAIAGGNTLQVDNKTTINQGGEIDLEASGAVLTSAGNMSNGGTLILASGGSVTVGTNGAPANFSNSITVSGSPVGGTINVDTTGAGGSTLTITGTLNNTNGALNIGNTGITSNATVVAQDFSTSGTLDGTIKITGPGSGSAQAALSLGTGVTTIASTGSLTLSGTKAFVELSTQTGSNSALTTLASNAGMLEVDNGAKVTINGNSAGLFANTGTIKTIGTIFDSTLDNITVAGSGGMTSSGTIDIAADGALRVTNGAFVQTNGGHTTVGGTSGNQAELHVDAATAPNSLGMDIQAGSELDVANYGNVDVGLNQAGKHRDLSNEGTITISSSGNMTVTGNLTNNSGTFTNNGFLSVTGNMVNTGTVTLNASGTIDPVIYTQTAGRTVVNGSLIAGMIDLQGGTLSGTGTVSGTINIEGGTLSGSLTTSGGVVNSATLTPNNGGSPLLPGTMSIGGSYTQTSTGTLDELIAGTAASGQYGQLNIFGTPGTADLGGTLDVLTGSFTNGFTFGSSDMYDAFLAAASGVSGTFSTIEFDCPGPNCVMSSGAELAGTGTSAPLLLDGGLYSMDVLYGSNAIDLQVTQVPTATPEPSSLLLLAIGLLGLGWVARRQIKASLLPD